MASASADSSPIPPFFVYILRCSDNSLYIGHASDVAARLKRHNEGRGAASIALRLPAKLVYQECHPTEAAAIRRELQLKRWTYAKKLALINGERAKLKSLAKRQAR